MRVRLVILNRQGDPSVKDFAGLEECMTSEQSEDRAAAQQNEKVFDAEEKYCYDCGLGLDI